MVNGWREFIVGDLFEFKNGLNKAKQFFGSGVPIVNYMDVYGSRYLSTSIIKGKVNLSKDEIKRFNAIKGDVFFTRTSETPSEIGYASVLLENIKDCVFSGFVLRGRPKSNALDYEFCKYAFMSTCFRKAVISTCSYTTRALTSRPLKNRVFRNNSTSNAKKAKHAMTCPRGLAPFKECGKIVHQTSEAEIGHKKSSQYSFEIISSSG